MIEQILPPTVRVDESYGERHDITLFPEENAAISRAVESRRREYTTVRACARDAMRALGHPTVPLVPGRQGAPGWPAGLVGSMTHCDGYRATAVARASHHASIGIDAEPDMALPARLLRAIATTDDGQAAETFAGVAIASDRLLFSAKEAVYKACFPLIGRLFSFQDVTVSLRQDGTFAARLLFHGAAEEAIPTVLAGRWMAGQGLLLTAVVVGNSDPRVNS